VERTDTGLTGEPAQRLPVSFLFTDDAHALACVGKQCVTA
jgi:hypothetical protein